MTRGPNRACKLPGPARRSMASGFSLQCCNDGRESKNCRGRQQADANPGRRVRKVASEDRPDPRRQPPQGTGRSWAGTPSGLQLRQTRLVVIGKPAYAPFRDQFRKMLAAVEVPGCHVDADHPLDAGIGSAPLWQVRTIVDRGELELILTRFEPPPVPVHAVWPATRMLPAKTQLFVDFLAARLKTERL